MKCTLIFLCLVGFAYGSLKLDLEFINRALTKIVNDEIQNVGNCMKQVLKCENNNKYPHCFDAPTNSVLLSETDIDTEEFIIFKLFKMELEGLMKMEDIKCNGLSDFVLSDVSSAVTVVPLGIEFQMTITWNNIVFESKYDLNNVTYLKYDLNTPMSGSGDMAIKFDKLKYKVFAHKILGGKMDYMKISSTATNFSVEMDEICLGDVPLTPMLPTKFDKKFIDDLDYSTVVERVMDFFNESLYPTNKRLANSLLDKLGECIYNNFPQ